MSLQPSTISIGSQVLLGDDDVNGVEWGFSTIKGWHSGPGTDVNRTQRNLPHGEFPQRGHRTGRVVTLTGYLWAPDRAKINGALDRLAAVLADGGFDTFTFADSDSGSRWTDVQLLDLDADWEGGTQADPPRYQLQLLSPSPYKFGAQSAASTGFFRAPVGSGLKFPLFTPDGFLDFGMGEDSGLYPELYPELYPGGGSVSWPGLVAIYNPGTADATVLLEVAGPTPVDGFTITNQADGKRIIWTGQVIPAGSTLSFDGRTGSVLINGVANRRKDAIIERWPVVPAGGNLELLFSVVSGAPSTAVMTASCYSTWW